MPSSISVQSFQTDGETMTMSFMVDTEAAIGEVVQNLRTFESLESVNFTSAAKEESETGEDMWSSVIEAYYKKPVNPYDEQTEEGAEETGEAENTEAAQ